MASSNRPSESSRDNSTPNHLGAHLISATLAAINEIVAELLETAELHQTSAPDLSRQMVKLATTIMANTTTWLHQAAEE
ncbi:hypothetical protein [Nocardia mangyaensis]|uniref:hypothetical protein n=1 Tax=Nocardia mangyaensis TaxID=2213200 RepID=UPI002674E058|nr:hypothetical protein [Nocardia mangyaensis]MDO3645671.1 hypothetical protein [Nocardia mangyaensis]